MFKFVLIPTPDDITFIDEVDVIVRIKTKSRTGKWRNRRRAVTRREGWTRIVLKPSAGQSTHTAS